MRYHRKAEIDSVKNLLGGLNVLKMGKKVYLNHERMTRVAAFAGGRAQL